MVVHDRHAGGSTTPETAGCFRYPHSVPHGPGIEVVPRGKQRHNSAAVVQVAAERLPRTAGIVTHVDAGSTSWRTCDRARKEVTRAAGQPDKGGCRAVVEAQRSRPMPPSVATTVNTSSCPRQNRPAAGWDGGDRVHALGRDLASEPGPAQIRAHVDVPRLIA